MQKRSPFKKILRVFMFSVASIGFVVVADMAIFGSVYHPLVYVYNLSSFLGCRNSPLPDCNQTNLRSPPPKAIVGNKGAVVTTQHEASEVGLQILQDGGNAIDAAVAVGYALAVTDPCCGNIGGGGFMLIHQPSGKDVFIDFREKAPLAATTDMYQDKQGKVIKGSSTKGYLAVGVPGTVAGLDYALSKFGTKNRSSVMAPAIALAKSGFVLQPGDVSILNAKKRFAEHSNVVDIFLKDGKTPYHAGEVLVQKNLAQTLSLISEQGKDAFYRGAIADEIVAASKANGGILTKADFTSYAVTEDRPVSCNYRGYKVISAPPPGGGTTLCQMLNILEGHQLKQLGWHSAKSLHLMLSAMLYAFGDRNTYLGDPKFVKNPVERLLSKAYAASIRRQIPPLQAIDPSRVYSGVASHEGTNTTHYSICDRYGNAVSVTYTINSYFGAGVIANNTGFFLNNEMDDFATKPGTSNQFGLVQGSANAIAPGKRPLSSMSPTIVTKDGKVFLVTGSPGGSTIPTNVLQIITNVIDYGMDIEQAVNAPRFHYQGLPNMVLTEPYALKSNSFQDLWKIGYRVVPFASWGASESILVNPKTHTFNGVNDPRKPAGKAVAY